jgi:hypothetical protein
VEVGHERKRAASLPLTAVECDRPRLCDSEGARGDCCADPLQLPDIEAVVVDCLDVARKPFARKIRRNRDCAGTVRTADRTNRVGDSARLDTMHRSAVVGHPLDE